MSGPVVEIKGPLEHQLPQDQSPARFKVLRQGRRAGKTRWAYKGSIVGHGPVDPYTQRPKFEGVVHGWDVFWIARDIPQSRTLWTEEIEPQFRGLEPHVKVNKTEKRIEFRGAGNLWIRSNENIDSVRGAGDRVMGVIIDEAAHLNLKAALREVVLPVLVDNGGWLVLMGTTNAGKDGDENEAGPITPSYFNRLCEQIQAGQRSGDWAEFYATAFDNPVLSTENIQALIDEYEEDSIDLAQEVYAKLVVGGAGLAFPEWEDDVHTTQFRPEQGTLREDYRWSAGMDWGYAKPGAFLLFASGPERSICRWEFYFKKTDPFKVGQTVGQRLLSFPKPEWISLDAAAFAVTDGGDSVAEQFRKGLEQAIGRPELTPPVLPSPKGSGSRVAGKQLLHKALRFQRDAKGNVPSWMRPQLSFHTDCANTIRTIPKLMKDEKNPEDVDTDMEDHAYDATRYWLIFRPPVAEGPSSSEPKDPDAHPGWDEHGRRKDAPKDPFEDVPEPRWTRHPQEV